MRQKFVEGKISIPGLHRWEAAPDHLRHLRADHRHLFVIRFAQQVTDNDRQVEFQNLSAAVNHYLAHQYPSLVQDGYEIDGLQFGARSCEMIAEDLVDVFDLTWCSVHEDDENGAMVLA